MTADTVSPTDRASFDDAMSAVLSDHATLRRLAIAAAKQPGFSTDATLSLAEAMASHESVEARLFGLPFITRPPETVVTTAARAHQRCLDFTTGNAHLPSSGAGAGLFIDALLAHLAAEEAWLAHEKAHQDDRRRLIA